MRTIWKYDLKLEGLTTLEMPLGAEVIHIEPQAGPVTTSKTVQMWVEVDTDSTLIPRRFAVYGTGHEFCHSQQVHVGSVFANGGRVFHVYEVLS